MTQPPLNSVADKPKLNQCEDHDYHGCGVRFLLIVLVLSETVLVLVLEIEIVTPCFGLANKSPVEIQTGANCGGGGRGW